MSRLTASWILIASTWLAVVPAAAQDAPVAEEPVAEEPVAREPADEEPADEEPVVQEPVADAPATDAPASDAPATHEPAAPHESNSEAPRDERVADEESEADTEVQQAQEMSIAFEPGDGLVIESGDQQFSLALRVRAQFLATLIAPEAILGVPEDTGDVYADAGDVDLGLSIRRARIVFAGHFFGRANRYKVELAISPADMGFDPDLGPTRTPLLDWYVDLRHLRDLSFRIGQYKLPVTRERVISSGDLAMVDRSLLNGELGLDRDLAIDVRSTDFLGLGLLRYYAGIGAGEGRDAGFGNDVGLQYFARVEVLPLGMFDDYSEADLERHPHPRLSLGAAYAFIDDAPRLRGVLGPRAADGGTTDYHTLVADLMFKWAGLSVQVETAYRDGTRQPGSAVDAMGNALPITAPRDGFGWFAQAGYLMPWFDLSIDARVGMLHPIGDASSTSMSEVGELGGALSYYIGDHSYKIQLDYFHLWQDGNFGSAEDRVRLQLQAAL